MQQQLLTWCLASSISMALGSPPIGFCSLSKPSVCVSHANSSSRACWNCPSANRAPSSLCYRKNGEEKNPFMNLTLWVINVYKTIVSCCLYLSAYTMKPNHHKLLHFRVWNTLWLKKKIAWEKQKEF